MDKFIRFFRHLAHEFVVIFMPRSLKKKMMSCQEAAELLDTMEKIPTFKRMTLNLHVSICQCCTNYKKQLDIIREASQKIKDINISEKTLQRITSSKANVLKNINSKK